MGEWARPSACPLLRAPACLRKPTRFHGRTRCHWLKIGRCSDLIRGWAAKDVGLELGGVSIILPMNAFAENSGVFFFSR